MMPIDFAEHHVAGEDHHFGGGLAFFGDRQGIARLVQAKAADQPALIEIAAIGDAGVQAVAGEIIHLVDVDRPGEHAGQDSRHGVARLVRQQGHHVARIDAPVVAQRVGNFAFEQKTVGEQFVGRHARQTDVFDRMAKRPMPQVVQQRGHDEQLGVGRRHRAGEARVVAQLPQKQQRQPIDAQRVLEARVMGRRIDQRHQPQLADLGQPAKLGRVDRAPARARSAARRARAESAPGCWCHPRPRLRECLATSTWLFPAKYSLRRSNFCADFRDAAGRRASTYPSSRLTATEGRAQSPRRRSAGCRAGVPRGLSPMTAARISVISR